MIQLKSLAAPLGLAALTLLVSTPALADNGFTAHIGTNDVQWSSAKSHGGATLTVSGPDAFYVRKRANNINGLRFSNFQKDGLYTYRITLEPRVKRVRPDNEDTTLLPSRNAGNKLSGSFRVVNGLPVDSSIKE